jgi:hypothetical protein
VHNTKCIAANGSISTPELLQPTKTIKIDR